MIESLSKKKKKFQSCLKIKNKEEINIFLDLQYLDCWTFIVDMFMINKE